MPEQPKSTIYIVDDERLIADTLATIMRNAGYAAEAFYNPRELLAAFTTRVPDLVLSDVVMPEMTGLELALVLQEEHTAVHCLLISGQAQTSILLDAARDRGQNFDVLTKPVHPSELLGRIRSLLTGTRERHAAAEI